MPATVSRTPPPVLLRLRLHVLEGRGVTVHPNASGIRDSCRDDPEPAVSMVHAPPGPNVAWFCAGGLPTCQLARDNGVSALAPALPVEAASFTSESIRRPTRAGQAIATATKTNAMIEAILSPPRIVPGTPFPQADGKIMATF